MYCDRRLLRIRDHGRRTHELRQHSYVEVFRRPSRPYLLHSRPNVRVPGFRLDIALAALDRLRDHGSSQPSGALVSSYLPYIPLDNGLRPGGQTLPGTLLVASSLWREPG